MEAILIFYGRLFIKKQNIALYQDSAGTISEALRGTKTLKQENWLEVCDDECTLVASATGTEDTDPHYPVIDLDVHCNLVPASRLGHSHLYINHPVPQEGLFEILDVLAKWGIVESGYAAATKARGYSAVRLPWVKKDKLVK
jgi:hypothetical protein